MALKQYKPTTPGQRQLVDIDRSSLWKGKPFKALTAGISEKSGRNNLGRITSFNRGGGHKRRYRAVDFLRNRLDIPAIVERIEYDPNRSARIALIYYKDGEKRYIIAPHGLKVDQKVLSGKGAAPEVGNTLFLSEIPLGTIIHNIELRPGQGAVLSRSAGSYAQLTARDGKYAILRMPSGEVRMILITCKATIGAVSNPDHNQEVHGKAGRKRWLGVRPRTRPVVMNPVDHPMGGGEGRASGGHPRSRKGIPAKGYKTRYKAKASNKHIIERRKK